MHSDTRNVEDRYKGWINDLIKDDLKKNSFPFAVMMENWIGDFNIGTVIRNANAFGAKEVFYIGRRHIDRRGAVGSYIYKDVTFLISMEELLKLKEKYTLIGLDKIPGSVPITGFVWPENTLMIFGEEGTGLTPATINVCEKIVEIPQYGSVRSLNAGCSSAVAMFDYVTKFSV